MGMGDPQFRGGDFAGDALAHVFASRLSWRRLDMLDGKLGFLGDGHGAEHERETANARRSPTNESAGSSSSIRNASSTICCSLRRTGAAASVHF